MTDERLDARYEHEHGPEWWAMDREFFCAYCGHSAYDHVDRLSDASPAPCRREACVCEDFEDEED